MRGHRLIAVRHQHSLPAAGYYAHSVYCIDSVHRTAIAGSAINRAILPIRDPAASLSFYQVAAVRDWLAEGCCL